MLVNIATAEVASEMEDCAPGNAGPSQGSPHVLATQPDAYPSAH